VIQGKIAATPLGRPRDVFIYSNHAAGIRPVGIFAPRCHVPSARSGSRRRCWRTLRAPATSSPNARHPAI